MSWAAFNKRTWTEHRLTSVLFELTYACNLDCEFCYNDLGLAGTPLTLAEYRKILDELAEMGVLNITLSGGEPLAHKDFFAIGAYARELGFVVRIKSNGHALRGTIARRLREEVDPYIVEVSLHGSTAAVHDRQTRVPGSFERLLANLEELRALGIRLKVNSTLTSYNEHQLEAMFAICDRLGAKFQVDPEVKPKDDGDREPVQLTASEAAKTRLSDILRERADRARAAKEAALEPTKLKTIPPGTPDTAAVAKLPRAQMEGSDKHCAAGSAHITIDPVGGVLGVITPAAPM